MKRLTLICVAALSSCGAGKGTAAFTTYGEDFIESEIPAGDGTSGFIDGWALHYSKFLVNIAEIKVADHTGRVGAQQEHPELFDMHQKGPVSIEAFENLDASDWDDVSYAIMPVADDTLAKSASGEDLALMKAGGYSVYIEAAVTKAAETRNIKWGFALNTQYLNCKHEDLGEGVTVPDGSSADVQLTIHGDHLYYDDLESAKAVIRFDAIAGADANGDHEVSLDELAEVKLTSLPIDQYGTGGASNVKSMRDFVTALARTLGHFRGEGECSPHIR